jgi:hypothetical protein
MSIHHWTWTARWIAPADVRNRRNASFRARRRWEISRVPASLIVHVAAESLYHLYVNGSFIARGPARGTRTVNFFDSHEIAPLLRAGSNWIAVQVHCHNDATSQAVPVEPALLVQSDDALLASDETWETQPADEWRSDVPLYTYQYGYMEYVDFRGEPAGWRIGDDDASWTAAVIVAPDHRIGGKSLLVRDIPALVESTIAPTLVTPIATTPRLDSFDDAEVARRMTVEPHRTPEQPIDTRYISPPEDGGGVVILARFDAQVNGRVEIDLDAPAGTILDIGYEEEAINGRLALTAFGYRFADRYILGEGRQHRGGVFASRGFRMVQIVLRNFSRPVVLHSIAAVQRKYPLPRRGAFDCSDPLLNQIWTACVETLSACSTDVIVDCPWRENTLWLNDLLVSNPTCLQAFGDPQLGARCFRLAASQPRDDGLLPGAVPAGHMPGIDDLDASIDSIVLLAANLFLANMLQEHYLYTLDESLARDMLDPLLRIHDTFDAWEDDAGLIEPRHPYWNFIDWSYPHPPDKDLPNSATLNWFRVWSLAATARLVDRFGERKRARKFSIKAQAVAAAIDRRFWSQKRNCYVECATAPNGLATQLTHAVALLSGHAPADRIAALVEALRRDDLLAPELYMHHLVLRAMVEAGRPADALKRIRRYWGPIVLCGSPTIGECGVHQPHAKSSIFGAASLCHGFSTTPIDFLQTVVLGVRPTQAGFARCSIRPHCLDLSHARGAVPTPHGNLNVNWIRRDNSIEIELDVPQGVIADLPDGRALSPGHHRVALAR